MSASPPTLSPLLGRARADLERVLAWAAPPTSGESLALVLDPAITPLLSRLGINLPTADVTELTEIAPLASNALYVLYIIRPTSDMIGKMAFQTTRLDIMKASIDSESPSNVFVAFIPAVTSDAICHLEQCGLYDRIQITSLRGMAVAPIESDLLSMENIDMFRRAFLEGDPSVVDDVVQTLSQIQSVYGRFTEIDAKGKVSSTIAEVFCKHISGIEDEDVANETSLRVLIIDRTLDLLTPLMTQLTYEGVIDECLGIRGGYGNIPEFVLAPNQPRNENAKETSRRNSPTKRCPLFSSDPVFDKIRDKSFAEVLSGMKSQVEDVKSKLEERNDAATVSDMRNFVKCLPVYLNERSSVAIHTNLAAHLADITVDPRFLRVLRAESAILERNELKRTIDTIEYSIVRGRPWTEPVRLLCLLSLIENGLSSADYDSFGRQLIHGYGINAVLPIMSRLSSLRMLFRSGSTQSPINWKTLKKGLNLINADTSVTDSYHFVHGYSGYAPLSIRLLEKRLSDQSWNTINSLLDPSEATFSKKLSKDKSPKATIVFVVGGITRSEIASIRVINASRPSGHQVMMATTGIITGNSLLESLRMQSPNG